MLLCICVCSVSRCVCVTFLGNKIFYIFQSLSSADGLGDSPVRGHDSRRNSQDDSRWHDSRHWNFIDSEISHRKHHYDNHRLR